MRILVVEDDEKIGSFVAKGLQQAGYAVDLCADGERALGLALAVAYDAAVVDLMLPKLDARQWLRANRQSWGIENGLHLRLDVSLRDDHCRVRTPNGLWIMGMLRRLANSLFIAWRQRQPKPQHKTTTDFQTAMDEENLLKAMSFVTAKRPKL